MDPQTAGVASPDVLLESLHPLIRRTVARLLPRRGPVDPDDVASGVVLDLLRVLRSEKRIDHPPSYIQRMVMHRILAETRKARRAQGSGPDPEGGDPLAEVADPRSEPPEAGMERRERAERVRAAVERLVESRRQVVKLHLSGFPREEIERVLGFSEAKVRNLLYRGLEDVREILTKEGMGDDTL